MKVLFSLLVVLSFNVIAEDEVCNYAARTHDGVVKVEYGVGDKVVVSIKEYHYMNGVKKLEFVGYESFYNSALEDIYVLNPEKIFKLIDKNGEFAELTLETINLGAQSRIPCQEARIPSPNCSPILMKKVKFVSDQFSLTTSCNGLSK
jgi:hypothetical protein